MNRRDPKIEIKRLQHPPLSSPGSKLENPNTTIKTAKSNHTTNSVSMRPACTKTARRIVAGDQLMPDPYPLARTSYSYSIAGKQGAERYHFLPSRLAG